MKPVLGFSGGAGAHLPCRTPAKTVYSEKSIL
jgi:hypothetical protein